MGTGVFLEDGQAFADAFAPLATHMLNTIGLEGVAQQLKHILPLAKHDGLLAILQLLDRPHQRHNFCAAQHPCIRASKCGVLARRKGRQGMG